MANTKQLKVAEKARAAIEACWKRNLSGQLEPIGASLHGAANLSAANLSDAMRRWLPRGERFPVLLDSGSTVVMLARGLGDSVWDLPGSAASVEHAKVVRQGAKAIARWAKSNPRVRLELAKIDLAGADLRGANLVGAHLREANLEGANLSNANLSMSNMRRVNLQSANLRSVKLVGTDLTGANLREACLAGAVCFRTVFGDLDLSSVKGLRATHHQGPSIVGVDTLFRSRGRIPQTFLQHAGVPRTLIEYLGSLRGEALQFYTCFISFSDADDLFSQRLYKDLQAAGIRCWRWKKDAKWGRTLMREVDEAIQVYDKLVVILSEQSLQAEPVIREIERALQKDKREGRDVLFPIRLDDAVFSWKHDLQADLLRKVIGDFRESNRKATNYRAALNRLIGGLIREQEPHMSKRAVLPVALELPRTARRRKPQTRRRISQESETHRPHRRG
jgi:uncharacterized protein YjbI with pentapeptide repeats